MLAHPDMGTIVRSALASRDRTYWGKETRSVSATVENPRSSLSRADVERVLIDIWQELLLVDVTTDDDFFEIGGYSLLIVNVVTEARKAGLDLAAKVVYEHRTIGRIATTLVPASGADEPDVGSRLDIGELWRDSGNPWARDAPSTIVPLSVDGTGEPLFFLHWGTGNVDFLPRLVDDIGAGRPVYGIEAAGYRHPVRPLVSIAEMAEYYLCQLRAVQPHGPYHLVGVCQGGLVGLEMARRLRADGEDVPVLALVNLPLPRPFLDPGWGLDDIVEFRLESLRDTYGLVDLERDLPRVLPEFTALGWYAEAEPAAFLRYQAVWAAGVFAQEHYQPRPYDGPVLMFHLTGYAEDTERMWGPMLTDRRTFVVEGEHTLPVLTSDVFGVTLRAALAAR